MKQHDHDILIKMRKEIECISDRSYAEAAEYILQLRDALEFNDTQWYHDLTQHVATIDSVSTFIPENDVDQNAMALAIRDATCHIMALIQNKLSS